MICSRWKQSKQDLIIAGFLTTDILAKPPINKDIFNQLYLHKKNDMKDDFSAAFLLIIKYSIHTFLS